ncbi:MAG: glycosyltransferase [Bdellovibrionaceae bacterium]|nr:glycosyltransferase [Pseudobdellovibrionaceae bacterium]
MDSSQKPRNDSHGISIVIPAFNEEKCLPETLSFINAAQKHIKQEFNIPTEVIVVDNASTDKTSLVANEFGARVVRHEVRNISSVRNAGIKQSSYDLVVTVDADTYVPLDAFSKIWTEMMTEKFIGGGVRMGIRSNRTHVRFFVSVMEFLMMKITGISLGMFFFSKDAALKIGGFRETHLAAEDMAFARDLRVYGKTMNKRFLNLRSVRILTFDRKNASSKQMFLSLLTGLKVLIGIQPKKEDLDYWYSPKR